MIIKKFKNGKIKMQLEKSDFDYYGDGNGNLKDDLYFNEIEMSDLYINQINGYQYLVDFHTQRVYELGSYLMQNPLKELLSDLEQHKTLYFYPLSKKESKSLLEDLANGY